MNDTQTTLNALKIAVKRMVDERDWNQFHTPKNLAMYISIEANELMAHFVHDTGEQSFEKVNSSKRQEIENELADIMIVLCAFANACDIDIAQAFEYKIAEVMKKYPVEKAKGKALKYSDL